MRAVLSIALFLLVFLVVPLIILCYVAFSAGQGCSTRRYLSAFFSISLMRESSGSIVIPNCGFRCAEIEFAPAAAGNHNYLCDMTKKKRLQPAIELPCGADCQPNASHRCQNFSGWQQCRTYVDCLRSAPAPNLTLARIDYCFRVQGPFPPCAWHTFLE